MNEQIKKLALQAGARLCGGYITPPGSCPMLWSSEGGIDTACIDLNKFASLIVNECADAADMAEDCSDVGDYIGEQLGSGTDHGICAWRAAIRGM